MYVLSGSIAGLAGVLLAARTTSGNPVNGTGLELQAITAVFLGGAATAGGKGTIFGTFLAVILVGVLNNGMNLLGLQHVRPAHRPRLAARRGRGDLAVAPGARRAGAHEHRGEELSRKTTVPQIEIGGTQSEVEASAGSLVNEIDRLKPRFQKTI